MINIEDKKCLVAYFNRHFELRISIRSPLVAQDLTWWINGKAYLFPITGTMTKAEFADINREMHASRGIAIQADGADPDSVKRLVEEATGQLGGLGIDPDDLVLADDGIAGWRRVSLLYRVHRSDGIALCRADGQHGQ